MKIAKTEAHYDSHHGSDLLVVNAARSSFGKWKTEFEPEKDVGLIEFLATGMRSSEWDAFLTEIVELGARTFLAPEFEISAAKSNLKQRLLQFKRQAQHWAPFGHPHVTLRLRMPIFLARQFVKHQVGGVWSEESRRYIDDEPEFYFEPVWMSRPDDIKQGAAGEVVDPEVVDYLMKLSTQKNLETYMHLVNRESGHKMAPEQAREILTLNMMTGVTWTGSLLFWSRVCNQRLDSHAQSAAQTLAKQISDIVGPLFPVSWKALTGVDTGV